MCEDVESTDFILLDVQDRKPKDFLLQNKAETELITNMTMQKITTLFFAFLLYV